MKDNGIEEKDPGLVNTFIKMEISMMVNGKVQLI